MFLPLLLISHLSRFSGALLEYCMAYKLTNFHYWRKYGGNLKEYKKNAEDILLQKLVDKADQLLKLI